MKKVSAVIPAAGSGTRLGVEKQFKIIESHPLWFHTIKPFISSRIIHEIIVVVQQKSIKSIEKILNSISVGKNIKAVLGGTNRQNSVQNGVLATDLESTLICVHDAARPFVTEELITASVSACDKYDGAIIALPCSDTVKLSDNSQVKETIDRNKIWLAQTPQTFNRYKLMQAYENADRNKIIATDESTLMEAMGFSIGLVEGHPDNFKITTQDDWERAEAVTFRKVQGRAQE